MIFLPLFFFLVILSLCHPSRSDDYVDVIVNKEFGLTVSLNVNHGLMKINHVDAREATVRLVSVRPSRSLRFRVFHPTPLIHRYLT